MKNNLSVFILICCLTIMSCQRSLIPESIAKGRNENTSVWPIDSMSMTPKYKVIFERDGVKGIVYEGLDYHGNTKETFAYYASPTTLGNGSEGRTTYPAVVCVHGGGGQAFEQWVKIWASKGYAAISMDLRGFKDNGIPLEHGFEELPHIGTPHFTANENIHSDWFFQAVADAVIAHSLIRSFDEVDSTRTALTGISWGGIITTLVAGLDNRFKACVPVYGCGYLYESGLMAPQIHNETLLAQKRWTEIYDPSIYASAAKMPMLFLNGTNDPCFYLDQWSKTYSLVADRVISLRYGLEHGHSQGWLPQEIYQFISNVLISKDTYPIPDLSKLKLTKNTIKGDVKIPPTYTKVFLNYTCDNNSELPKRVWTKTQIDFDIHSNKINIAVDANCRMCAISVEDSEGNHFSSPLLINNN